MGKDEAAERFAQVALPHLDAAFNLARWLARDDHVAQDVVQEACLRALRFFDSFRGGDGRAWLLAIVRNTYYTWHRENRGAGLHEPYDEEKHAPDGHAESAGRDGDPQAWALRDADARAVREAIEALPEDFREVLVLRELEGLSYKEIAEVARIPAGTVMSRLARARNLLRERLCGRDEEGRK